MAENNSIISKIENRVYKNSIIIAVLLIPYFEPTFNDERLPVVHGVFFLLKCLSAIVAVALMVRRQRLRKASCVFLCIAVFQLFLCGVTAVKGGDVVNIAKASASVICMAYLVEVFVRENPDGLIKALGVYFLAYAAVTLVTTLLFPHGLYLAGGYGAWDTNAVRYFAGHKNQLVPSLLPGYVICGVAWLRAGDAERSRRVTALALTVGYGVTMLVIALVADSVTSAIVSALLLVAIPLCRVSGVQRVPAAIWMVIVLVVDVLVSLLRVQNLGTWFVALLGRGTTLSGRTAIWDAAEQAIVREPIVGHGVLPDDAMRDALGGFQTAHNVFLTTAFYGGAVGIALLVACLLVAARELARNKGAVATFFALCIAAVLVNGIFESLGMGLTVLAFPLILAGSCGWIAGGGTDADARQPLQAGAHRG